MAKRDHEKAVKHFESESAGHGYGKSTIRSIFNKYLKGK